MSATVYLAKAGNDVHVFEKHDQPRGRARQFSTEQGYVFDVGLLSRKRRVDRHRIRNTHLEYIKKWISEFGTDTYPQQIVEHSFARERALKVYGEAVRENNQ